MSDLPADNYANGTAQPTTNAPAPPIADPAECKERKSQRLKRYCIRKLHKAPVWIEAACAVALVAITGTYTHYASGQLQEMRKATEATKVSAEAAKESARVAKDTLIAGNRPWVASEFVATYLLFKEDGGFLGLNMTVSNVGHSVAQSISAWTELWLDTRTLLSEGDKYCEIPKNPVNKSYRGGFILFPGQHRTFDQPAAARSEDIERALASGDFKEQHMVTIYVITCIDYISPLDSEHHQTRRYFNLTRPDPVRNIMLGVFDPHGTYAPSKFIMSPQGWEWAD
jgi:hypothetical protein